MVAVSTEDGHPLRVELLGALRASQSGRELEIGPPRQGAVLAMLVLGANRVVTRDELVDGVWGTDPPASVVNRVHVLVGGLRRELEPDRARRAPGLVLSLTGAGYRLTLAPGQRDIEAFHAHLRRARDFVMAGDFADAVQEFDAALALWRGTPLSGVPGPFADAERARYLELRTSAVEARAQALLDLGDIPAATADLRGLVAGYPLRERLRALLMIALYRGGRRAEALALFAETRALLIDELGIEPGSELQRLHRAILADRSAEQAQRIESPGRMPVGHH
jgi:DNA-binding SARP family transcriptional activator